MPIESIVIFLLLFHSNSNYYHICRGLRDNWVKNFWNSVDSNLWPKIGKSHEEQHGVLRHFTANCWAYNVRVYLKFFVYSSQSNRTYIRHYICSAMLKKGNFHLPLKISFKVTGLEWQNNKSIQRSSSRKNMSHDTCQWMSGVTCSPDGKTTKCCRSDFKLSSIMILAVF